MPIIRNFQDSFSVADYTPELIVIPNQWGTINELGIFSEEGIESTVVQFEEITKDGALIVDKVRGERASVGKDSTRKIRSWSVPHFPHDDYISPNDIKGRSAYGAVDQEERLANVRARKLERIAQNHAWTLEYARSKLITTGDVYAPSGTVSMNFFTEFGVTRKEVDIDLDTGSTDVLAKSEECIAHILDNANGSVVTGIIGLCSPEFFGKLISHASVKAAYQYYSSTQEPLRQRAGGATAMHREFVHGGIRYIEMRDSLGGTIGAGTGSRLIPANDAYFIPTGTDIFTTYFAAANKFDLIGTMGERAYVFEYPSSKGDKIDLESESNFLNAVKKPAMIVRGYTG
jgi:hypothetical protein